MTERPSNSTRLICVTKIPLGKSLKVHLISWLRLSPRPRDFLSGVENAARLYSTSIRHLSASILLFWLGFGSRGPKTAAKIFVLPFDKLLFTLQIKRQFYTCCKIAEPSAWSNTPNRPEIFRNSFGLRPSNRNPSSDNNSIL